MPGVDKSRGRRAAPKIDDKRSDSGAGGVAHYSIRPNQEVLTNGGLAAGGLIDKLQRGANGTYLSMTTPRKPVPE